MKKKVGRCDSQSLSAIDNRKKVELIIESANDTVLIRAAIPLNSNVLLFEDLVPDDK